jgi:hypothetical protein
MVFPHHKDNFQPFRGQSAQGFIMGVPLRPLVGSGVRDTLNRLIEALTKAIGPVAPQIVREHIAALCESRYAFPESRIRELMALIEREMTYEELLNFHGCIPEELRELGNA